jgi:hypothetical protein
MSSAAPHEPEARQKPNADVTSTRHDESPPAPPRELPRSSDPGPREFVHDGRRWAVWLSGKSAYGTGSYGLGLLEAVHFAEAARPDVPLREALLARGRFEQLFEAELAALLERATPITPAAARP